LPRTEITSPKLPAPMRRGAFSSGVEAPAGRTIYVSGQVSMDAAGNVVGEGDIGLQTETVLEHVKTVVEEAGGGMEDVVKVTVFITDMGLYDEIHEVRRRYFEEPYPASSMVEVSALIDPRLLIEIEAVAVVIAVVSAVEPLLRPSASRVNGLRSGVRYGTVRAST
jgi:2-iminobutanoate/2-iminopropanoate deaminase